MTQDVFQICKLCELVENSYSNAFSLLFFQLWFLKRAIPTGAEKNNENPANRLFSQDSAGFSARPNVNGPLVTWPQNRQI